MTRICSECRRRDERYPVYQLKLTGRATHITVYQVLTERKPKWSRSSNETFRENLRDAVSEAGVQPITGESAADVVAAAQLDPVLLESYEAEMKAKVAKRIRSDPDFDPQKYPNAAAYFK